MSAVSGTTPIESGILQNNLNADGNYHTNVEGVRMSSTAALGLGQDKEIWISFRTDGIDGAGTQLDPRDVSTALKFDALMRGLAINTVVHIGRGTFLTTGSFSFNETLGYYLPAGTKLIGAGKFDTIIQQSAYPVSAGGNGHYIFETNSSTDSGVEISDLTLDCNWNTIKSVLTPTGSDYDAKTAGAGICGNNCKLVRVRCINAYGNLGFLREAFPLFIFPHTVSGVYQTCTGAEISDTDSELFQGDYGVAIGIASSLNGINGSISGKIFNNRITDWAGTCAIGMGGNGKEIFGNVIKGGRQGIYMDTYKAYKANIHHNHITDVSVRGIQLSPSLIGVGGGQAEIRDIKITDNIVEVNRTGASTAICISIAGQSTPNVFNVEILRNRCIRGATGAFPTQSGIACAYGTGVVIDGNVIDSDLENNLFTGVADNTYLTVRNNLTNLGGIPSALFDTSSSGSGNFGEDTVSFLATTNGWYRIASGSAAIGGFIQISSEQGANPAEVAFDYEVEGYTLAGSITQRRLKVFNTPAISQARISSDGSDNVYLDINVTVTDATKPFNVYSFGSSLHRATLNASPTVGAVVGASSVKTITFAAGLVTTESVNVAGVYKVAGTQVLGTRKTGWTAATGTAARTTFVTSTVTLEELAKRVKAIQDDLISHGVIGT